MNKFIRRNKLPYETQNPHCNVLERTPGFFPLEAIFEKDPVQTIQTKSQNIRYRITGVQFMTYFTRTLLSISVNTDPDHNIKNETDSSNV